MNKIIRLLLAVFLLSLLPGGVYSQTGIEITDDDEFSDPERDNTTEIISDEESETVIKPRKNVFDEAEGKILRWRFKKGEMLEVRKYSEQKIRQGSRRVNRKVFHRVALEVKDVIDSKGYFMQGVFSSNIRTLGAADKPYETEERHKSSFYIEPRGLFHVPDGIYMPNVRNIPVFPPEKDPGNEVNPLKRGDQWSHKGLEIMKFSRKMAVPLKVRYRYLGVDHVEIEGKVRPLHKIAMNYQINNEYAGSLPGVPRKLFGFVDSVIFWDASEGIPYFKKGNYDLLILYRSGVSREFKISSKSYYSKRRPRNENEKEQIVKKLRDNLADELTGSDKNIDIKTTDEGISINLPDVHFDYDSAELTSESRDILDSLAQTLEKAGEARILVRGHTDNIGTVESNKKLSKERARAVATYILDETGLRPENILYEGRGAGEPVASNATEEGRKKNRRVEIILLDN